jgi:DNA-binding HxlR family transcriptional regulator
MTKRYERYCPMAHALDLVGERWALLVVLELMHGSKRYSDLADNLPGIGTNILASRLRDLEANAIITRRTLPKPAASRVYELTEYGQALRPAMRELALWGAQSLGPPTLDDELFEGWLANAVDIVLAPFAPPGRFEFRADDEVASLVDGQASPEPIDNADVVVSGTPESIYHMFVDQRLDIVDVEGNRELLEQLIAVAPANVNAPVTVSA